ncbi:MAG: 5-(carboxyamino)imidazole ribonucleotide mutase [Aerococcus sp.]|nr:5-(carboxyamino)imidazole ribonucleotide mutase [Aerococcus sp.]
MTSSAKVAIVMGSRSDWEQMRQAADMLTKLAIPFDKKVVSAHRMPDEMFAFAHSAQDKGYEVIIAAAGGAAHLPGMIAAKTLLPVIGVPMKSKTLNGIDSLLSIVQMPAGIPVMTMAIGSAGATNAALAAARFLAVHDTTIEQSLKHYQQQLHDQAKESSDQLNG